MIALWGLSKWLILSIKSKLTFENTRYLMILSVFLYRKYVLLLEKILKQTYVPTQWKIYIYHAILYRH